MPFRATALTRALCGALGGGVRTTLVACVWDSPAFSSETLATCRCARQPVPASAILPAASRSGNKRPSLRVQLLQRQLRSQHLPHSTCLM